MAVIVKTVNMPKTCNTCDFMEWMHLLIPYHMN